MNNHFTKKILSLVVLGLFSQVSYAVQEKECNSTDTLQGWGIWCGVDTYLTQQEPTAAGPVGSSPTFNGNVSFDSQKFGGAININEAPPSDPDFDNYQFAGYALATKYGNKEPSIQSEGPSLSSTSLVKLYANIDEENEVVEIKALFEDGKVVHLSSTHFYSYNYPISNLSHSFPGFSSTHIAVGPTDIYKYNYAYSGREDNSEYGFNSYFSNESGYEYEYLGGSSQTTHYLGEDVSYGSTYLYNRNFNEWIDGGLGKPTSLSDMKSIQGTVAYQVMGVGSLENSYQNIQQQSWIDSTMSVNFTAGLWSTDNLNHLAASGKIQGNKFSSNNITSNIQGYNVIDNKSSVNGHFAGTGAAQVLGQVNAQVQNTQNAQDISQIRGVFVGAKNGTPSDAFDF